MTREDGYEQDQGDNETGCDSKVVSKLQSIGEKKKLIEEKGNHKDWQEKEIALKEMEMLFRDCSSKPEIAQVLDSEFLQCCLVIL